MKIINLIPNENGSYENSTWEQDCPVPDGWAVIPDNISIPDSFPFVKIEFNENNEIISLSEIPLPDDIIKEYKNKKKSIFSKRCSKEIKNGIDIILSDQTKKHFSFMETDQLNILSAYYNVNYDKNNDNYLYHADGEDYELYSKEDIETIFTKLNENKNNILLRYKKLCAYIDTLNIKEDIDNVDYDMDIL